MMDIYNYYYKAINLTFLNTREIDKMIPKNQPSLIVCPFICRFIY